MQKGNVLIIAVMAFAIVAFLFIMDYSLGKGKWPWTTNVSQISNNQNSALKLADAFVCTEKPRSCPDGSILLPFGPNCEFTTCPSANTNSVTNTTSNTNTSTTTSLRVIVKNKLTNALITDTAVSVYSDNGIRCVTTPCPTNGRTFEGGTNTQGEVTIPAANVDESMTFTVVGYQDAELHTSGKLQSDGSWNLPLTKK